MDSIETPQMSYAELCKIALNMGFDVKPIYHKSNKPKESKRFTKSYAGVVKELVNGKVLSDDECAFLFKILPYCEMNTNFLVKRAEKKTVPMDVDDLVEVIGKSDRIGRSLVRDLVNKNILCKADSGLSVKYCLNPELYWNGYNGPEKAIYERMFYSKQAELLEQAKHQLQKYKKVYVNGRACSILKEAKRIDKKDVSA